MYMTLWGDTQSSQRIWLETILTGKYTGTSVSANCDATWNRGLDTDLSNCNAGMWDFLFSHLCNSRLESLEPHRFVPIAADIAHARKCRVLNNFVFCIIWGAKRRNLQTETMIVLNVLIHSSISTSYRHHRYCSPKNLNYKALMCIWMWDMQIFSAMKTQLDVGLTMNVQTLASISCLITFS